MTVAYIPKTFAVPLMPRPYDPWFNFFFIWCIVFVALFANNASSIHPFVAPVVCIVFFLHASFILGEDGEV